MIIGIVADDGTEWHSLLTLQAGINNVLFSERRFKGDWNDITFVRRNLGLGFSKVQTFSLTFWIDGNVIHAPRTKPGQNGVAIFIEAGSRYAFKMSAMRIRRIDQRDGI